MSQSILEEPTLAPVRSHGPMLSLCPVPECGKLTMGGTCVEHDEPVRTVFPRGRPYVANVEASDVAVAPAS